MPRLNSSQKQILDKIVQEHYSEKIAEAIKQVKEDWKGQPDYPQKKEHVIGGKSSASYYGLC